MKRKPGVFFLTLPLLLLTSVLLGACGAGEQSAVENTSSGNSPDAAAAPVRSGPFGALATSAISVDLSWDPVDGATGYRVENQFGDSEWFVLAELGADAANYEDFPAPSNMELNYRLTPLMGEADGKAFSTSVITPEVIPNPLAVKVKLEEPDYNNIGLAIPGLDPSTFDPSTFDPSSLDLSGIDPENLSAANLGPKPVSAHGRIGPSGGSLSVTGKNGVTYILDVPPDALDFAVYFTLTPVSEIEDYPFSGGYFGAVNVQPEGIIFDAPVTISFKFPGDAPPDTGGLPGVVPVAFAFEQEGQEFHLTPYATDTPGTGRVQPAGSTKLSGPTQQGNSTMVVTTTKSTSVGAGPATAGEAHDQAANHPPTDAGDQSSQQAAARQVDDELAPLVDEETVRQYYIRRATEIVDGMNHSGSIIDLNWWLGVRFMHFYMYGDFGKIPVELQERMFQVAASNLRYWLHPEICPSPEADLVQAWVRRMVKPRNDFDVKLREHLNHAWGLNATNEVNQILRDLEFVQGCKVKLVLKSTVKLGDIENDCIWQMDVTAEVPLSWRNFGTNKAYLQGGPKEDEHNLKYEQPFPVLTKQDPPNSRCTQVVIGGIDASDFVVLNLTPRFEVTNPSGGRSSADWDLRYRVGGVADEVKITWEEWAFENGKNVANYNTTTEPVTDPGGDRDPWGGAMALMAVRGTGGWIGRLQWKIYQAGGGATLAEWQGNGAFVDEKQKHSHETTLKLEPQE